MKQIVTNLTLKWGIPLGLLWSLPWWIPKDIYQSVVQSVVIAWFLLPAIGFITLIIALYKKLDFGFPLHVAVIATGTYIVSVIIPWYVVGVQLGGLIVLGPESFPYTFISFFLTATIPLVLFRPDQPK